MGGIHTERELKQHQTGLIPGEIRFNQMPLTREKGSPHRSIKSTHELTGVDQIIATHKVYQELDH